MRPLALIAAVLSSLTLLPVAATGQATLEDTVRQAPLFEATIDDPDLVMSLKEIARERNRSWLKIDLVSGSGVGSSLWMVCQVRLLTELRGFSHFVVLEQVSDVDGAMEIGFLQSDSVDLKAEFGKDDFEYGEGLIVGPEMCAGRSLQTDTLRLLPTRLTLGSGPPLARQILPVLQPSELCSDQPGTAIATFEDAELEVWVRRAVRRATLSVGAQDDLTCGLVSGLADLGAMSARIESLVGIQNLTSLSTLDLTNNAITDISALRGLTSLTTLRLAFNSISEISALRGLTNLTTLLLNGNSISDITPLSGLTNLSTLYLGNPFQPNDNNSITDISALRGLTSLTTLHLSFNSISEISALRGLTNLTTLGLNGNFISDITPLSGLTNLSILLLGNRFLGNRFQANHNNAITDISALRGLTSLTTLHLGYNSVSEISALRGLTNLTTLGLNGNSISDISAVSGLTNLTSLNLESNSISDITPLSGLTNLSSLYLGNRFQANDNNSITDISALRGLTGLTTIDLRLSADLSNIQPLLNNLWLGRGDQVVLTSTKVSCWDVAALEAKGVTVNSDCP